MENKKYIVYIDESNILSQKGNSVYVILYIVYLNKDIVIKNIQDIEKALKNNQHVLQGGDASFLDDPNASDFEIGDKILY